MQFSKDGLTWSEVMPYKKTSIWTLEDGSDAKLVYVRFRDRDGNWSEPISNTSSQVLSPKNLRIISE